MRTRLLVVGLLTSVAASLVPATAGAQAGVTKEGAEQVAREFTAANERNNATLDVEGQAAVEDAPIRTIDDATFREYKGRGQTTLGQDSRVEDRVIFVAKGSEYPLRFLASEEVVFGDNAPARQLLLFTRESEAAPWKVTMASQLFNAPPELQADGNGFVKLLDNSTDSLRVRPTQLAKKLARLWDSGKSTSKTFRSGPLTTEWVNSIVDSVTASGIGRARITLTFEAGADQPVCFESSSLGALCFFVVSYEQQLRPASGQTFVQPASRQPLTGHVVPGEYREVTYQRTAIVAANVPPGTGNTRVNVIGIYEGITSADATTSDAQAV